MSLVINNSRTLSRARWLMTKISTPPPASHTTTHRRRSDMHQVLVRHDLRACVLPDDDLVHGAPVSHERRVLQYPQSVLRRLSMGDNRVLPQSWQHYHGRLPRFTYARGFFFFLSQPHASTATGCIATSSIDCTLCVTCNTTLTLQTLGTLQRCFAASDISEWIISLSLPCPHTHL